MTDISQRYARLAAELTHRVDAVPAERWDDPSPCPGWSARDVVRHLLDSHRTMPEQAGVQLTWEASVDDDPIHAWGQARDAMQALLDDPERAGREYDGYFGRTTVQETVDRFLGFDLLVHAWDLARATGLDETLPEDEVRRTYAEAVEWGDSLRMEGVCGPPVTVDADAPEQDRLLAFLGRRP